MRELVFGDRVEEIVHSTTVIVGRLHGDRGVRTRFGVRVAGVDVHAGQLPAVMPWPRSPTPSSRPPGPRPTRSR